MNVEEYQRAVIALFKSGKATDKQWAEMAACVLNASEGYGIVEEIDGAIEREFKLDADRKEGKP